MYLANKKIYVAGSNGMVGSAICRLLEKRGFSKKKRTLLKTSRYDLDLTDQINVKKWFSENRPEIVIIAAAKVGGIMANNSNPVTKSLSRNIFKNFVIAFS